MQPPPSGADDAPGGRADGPWVGDRGGGRSDARDERCRRGGHGGPRARRPGLRVQLESLTAGIRAQFVRAHRRQSGQTQITINRIVAEHFVADGLYTKIRLEFLKSLEPARLEQALAW